MTLTIQEVQLQLPSLIHDLRAGSEVEITENGVAVAKIVPVASDPPKRLPQLGGQRGSVLYMAPDFDAPLEDFHEYMG